MSSKKKTPAKKAAPAKKATTKTPQWTTKPWGRPEIFTPKRQKNAKKATTKAPAKKATTKAPAKKATTKAKVAYYWEDMTPAQRKQYKKDLAAAIAKAKRDIGGPTPYTVLRTTRDGWKICAANHPLDLRITQQCIDKAVCSSKEECVVAQAIQRQEKFATDWMVGTNITIVTCEPLKMVIKYGTSSSLARAIPKYDTSTNWDLKPGLHRLNPLPVGYRLGNRFLMLKRQENRVGGKKSVFKGTAKAPTRSGTMYQIMRRKKAA
jgi:hypothetical protein